MGAKLAKKMMETLGEKRIQEIDISTRIPHYVYYPFSKV